MRTHPISVDYYLNMGSGDSADYTISATISGVTEVIYQGKAWKRPGDDAIHVKINDICANYIKITFPQLLGLSSQELPRFKTESAELLDEVIFLPDYSDAPASDRYVLSDPINGRVDERQMLIYSEWDASEVLTEFEESGQWLEDTTFPVNEPQLLSVLKLDLKNSHMRGKVRINGNPYEVVDTCAKYALYYVNALGGWDSFLIEGNHKETDSVTRHTHSLEYDNRIVSNRGRENYLNEITKKITLYSSWLTDEQSSRMHHLLNATQVYLYDLETQELKPVLLTNTSTEYKTYKGNGGKLVNYEIEVELANERIRR